VEVPWTLMQKGSIQNFKNKRIELAALTSELRTVVDGDGLARALREGNGERFSSDTCAILQKNGRASRQPDVIF